MVVSGRTRNGPRRYVGGHNLRGLRKTAAHRAAIGEAQRRAWQTVRKRLPVGARNVDSDGYVRIKVEVGAGRWKLEHLIVVERRIGRPLALREIVHHINGDRSDNRSDNLFLCRDRAHHNAVHRSQDAALRRLLSAGLVVFRDGHYEAVLRPD